MPRRLRLGRALGYRKPAGAVVVGRPGKWGNPFRAGQPHPERPGELIADAAEAVRLFEHHLRPGGRRHYLTALLHKLAGRDLACWCKPGEPCHADVLLRLANPDQETTAA